MNWSQTKSIFIIVFLLLNIFLGFQLWEKQFKNLELAEMYESSLEEMLSVRNIAMEADLSAEQPELGQLHVQHALQSDFAEFIQEAGEQSFEYEEGVLRADVRNRYELNVPAETTFEAELFHNEWMQNYVFKYDEYAFDRFSNGRIVFLQHYQSLPIFTGRLEFKVNDDQEINAFEQVHYHMISQGTEQQVLSSYSALRALLENQIIPANTTIVSVRLGYYGQIYEVESQVLTPSWRVRVEHGDNTLEFYVNAFTGSIETSESDDAGGGR
jgi:regulatory protein YycI of two-component signal transduction system YycFG